MIQLLVLFNLLSDNYYCNWPRLGLAFKCLIQLKIQFFLYNLCNVEALIEKEIVSLDGCLVLLDLFCLVCPVWF
jgi:hypothetical protein